MFKAGRLKDMSGFWRMPTDEESDKFQGLIGQMYDLFVSVVTDSRKMTDEQVRELATGEVYTARQAQEAGLIDRLGGFDDAIAEAMRLSGARRKIRHYQPKRPILQPHRVAGARWRIIPPRPGEPRHAGVRRYLLPGAGDAERFRDPRFRRGE